MATQHCFNCPDTVRSWSSPRWGWPYSHRAVQLILVWQNSQLGEDAPKVQPNSCILILPAELLINRGHTPNFPTFTQGKALIFWPFDEVGYPTLIPSKQDIQFPPGHYIRAGESSRLLQLWFIRKNKPTTSLKLPQQWSLRDLRFHLHANF